MVGVRRRAVEAGWREELAVPSGWGCSTRRLNLNTQRWQCVAVKGGGWGHRRRPRKSRSSRTPVGA